MKEPADTKPKTFVRFEAAREAYDVFLCDASLGDHELITLYESLVRHFYYYFSTFVSQHANRTSLGQVNSNPKNAPTYHGALLTISLSRPSPSPDFHLHQTSIIAS